MAAARVLCDAFIERGPHLDEPCHFPARYRVLTIDEVVCGHHARAWVPRVLAPLDEGRARPQRRRRLTVTR